jgi:hypothetical protein
LPSLNSRSIGIVRALAQGNSIMGTAFRESKLQ